MPSATGSPRLTSGPCLARFHDGTPPNHPVQAQEDDGRLCGFADRIYFASPRQNGAAAFMDRSVFNDKSARLERTAKGFVGRGLLRINPDDQHPGRAQELHEPVKRDFQSFERAPPPVNQRYAVLAGRMAAVCRGGRASIAAAMQLQHQLDGPGPGYDDSVLLGAACKRNHRFNDAVACGSGTRGSHDVTILIWLLELRGIRRLVPARHLARAEPVCRTLSDRCREACSLPGSRHRRWCL